MDIINKAKQLRIKSTDAERLFWRHIRNRQLLSRKFRRQMPFDRYIVDFVCQQLRLIVELDGGQHADQSRNDARRTRYLEAKGYRVVRFWNNEVLLNTDGVLEALSVILTERERELKMQSPSP